MPVGPGDGSAGWAVVGFALGSGDGEAGGAGEGLESLPQPATATAPTTASTRARMHPR